MAPNSITNEVAQTLRKVGSDIRDARKRRRVPIAALAHLASISRTTLAKVEMGLPGVAFGTYAAVLLSLGMINRLADVADPRYDDIGRRADEERLPQRIRLRKLEQRRDENLPAQAASARAV
jgi:transcriptional regulator with XRE-family HTH domain